MARRRSIIVKASMAFGRRWSERKRSTRTERYSSGPRGVMAASRNLVSRVPNLRVLSNTGERPAPSPSSGAEGDGD